MYPQQNQRAYGDGAYPSEMEAAAEKEAAMLASSEDRPESATEGAMSRVEMEIMKIDEEVTRLYRRLRPVIYESAGSETVPGDPDGKARLRSSPLGQSLEEKGRRLREIRHRLSSLADAVDL